MRALTVEDKRAVADQALRDLAVDYVRLYGQVVSALETGSGPSVAQFLREQAGASGRLRAQIATLSGAIESGRLEIALRERQARRQEEYLHARNEELARLRELLEQRAAWANEQEGAAQLLSEEQAGAAEAQPAAPSERESGDQGADAKRLALRSKRDLLRDWVRMKTASPDGASKLRAELQRLYRLHGKLETANEKMQMDAQYAEVQINLQSLGLDARTADPVEVVRQLEAATAQMERDLSAAHAQLAESAGQVLSAQADERGRAAAVRWLEGDLAGRRLWRELGLSDSAVADGAGEEEPQIPRLLRRLRQEDAVTRVAEAELRGRQDQLRWLRGTIDAAKSWSSIAESLGEAEVRK